MLQRKQSLFLALAALLLLSSFLFPVATYQVKGEVYSFRLTGLVDAAGVPVEEATVRMPFHLVMPVLAAVFIVGIFLYRNRPRQIRLVRGASLMVMVLTAFLFITDNSVQAYLKDMAGATEVQAGYGLAFILPPIALILALLAVRAIKADEELVRSADRLR